MAQVRPDLFGIPLQSGTILVQSLEFEDVWTFPDGYRLLQHLYGLDQLQF